MMIPPLPPDFKPVSGPTLRRPGEERSPEAIPRSAGVDDRATGSMFTSGLSNGRAWRSLSQDARVMLLEGAFEVLQVSGSGEPLLKQFPKTMNMGQMATALDGFYGVPENIDIPIFYAAQVVTLQANGEPAMGIDIVTRAMRGAAGQVKK